MSRVMPITGALAAVMVAVAPGALAQAPSSQTSSDSTYIREAMSGNYLEVALGRVAESRAGDQSVKDFAKRMITDHNSMNDQWATVAKNNRLPVPLGLDPAGQQSVKQLQGLSGSAFDQAYMAEMVRQHEQALATFQRIASSAGTTEVRQLASSEMPTIREHVTLAQQVGNRVGISTTAGRAGGVTGPTPSGDSGRLRAADVAFVQNVLQNHMTHIRMAELAQREATSDQVRQLAERIESHMKDWEKRWENVADRYDVKVADHLGRLHQRKVDRVERASKKDFDRTYLEVAAAHLESLVPYFQKEGHAVEAADARRLVNDELPEIRDLLARARRLEGQASARGKGSYRK
jgi:putative membrane protein